MIRTVYVPLTREPDILFGLRLSQLFWIAAAGVADLALWHQFRVSLTLRCTAMGGLALIGILLATLRFQDATLPEWISRAIMFWLKPHLYLP